MHHRMVRYGKVPNISVDQYWINILNHFVFKKEIPSKQYLPIDIVVKENAEFYIAQATGDLEFVI